jgi:hypothetical protein
MDIQTRYSSKSECFERTVQKALTLKDGSLLESIRENLGQVPVLPKDRPEWEYVIRANIWDHVVCPPVVTANLF